MVDVGAQLTLDHDVESYNETEVRLTLAQLYGVSLDAVTVEVSAGSLLVQFSLTAPLQAGLPAESSGGLNASSLSEALGVPLSVDSFYSANRNVTSNQTVIIAVTTVCPPGFWCASRLPDPLGGPFVYPSASARLVRSDLLTSACSC